MLGQRYRKKILICQKGRTVICCFHIWIVFITAIDLYKAPKGQMVVIIDAFAKK